MSSPHGGCFIKMKSFPLGLEPVVGEGGDDVKSTWPL